MVYLSYDVSNGYQFSTLLSNKQQLLLHSLCCRVPTCTKVEQVFWALPSRKMWTGWGTRRSCTCKMHAELYNCTYRWFKTNPCEVNTNFKGGGVPLHASSLTSKHYKILLAYGRPIMIRTGLSRWVWQNSSTPEAKVALKRACLTSGWSHDVYICATWSLKPSVPSSNSLSASSRMSHSTLKNR